jgi:hypothetical protein
MNEMFEELEERKRREFAASISTGRVGDPITATVFGSALLAKVLGGVAIAVVSTIGTSPLSRCLPPSRPGRMTSCR